MSNCFTLRLLSLALAACMLLSFVACSSASETVNPSASDMSAASASTAPADGESTVAEASSVDTPVLELSAADAETVEDTHVSISPCDSGLSEASVPQVYAEVTPDEPIVIAPGHDEERAALAALAEEFATVNVMDYSVASYTAYMDMVDRGIFVLADESATAEGILDAAAAIEEAKAALTVDKTHLQSVVKNAPAPGSFDTDGLTEEVLSRYAAALADAELVLADGTASQYEVDLALTELSYAKNNIFGVDYSALEAAVAKAPEVIARKDRIVPIFYQNYVDLIAEAKDHFLNAPTLRLQWEVNEITEDILVLHSLLKSGHYDAVKVQGNLPTLMAAYKGNLLIHSRTPFIFEGWIAYHTSVTEAKDLLATGAYDYNSVNKAIERIQLSLNIMYLETPWGKTPVLESFWASRRTEMIDRVGLQTDTVRSGGTVRIAITTPRAKGVGFVMIVNEEGVTVTAELSYGALNRRKPGEKVIYADLQLMLAPGTYTFQVYVAKEAHAYCNDPEEFTITVE